MHPSPTSATEVNLDDEKDSLSVQGGINGALQEMWADFIVVQ
jgi:hypothetical protein